MQEIAIECKNLTKNFGKKTAIKNVSFSINKGEIFGYVGPNGSGKTTTIKILATLLRPTDGSAFINSWNVVSQSEKVKELIGYLPEIPIIYKDLTAYEYLHFFGSLYGMKGEKLENRINSFLYLMELKGERKYVQNFSKGMMQRLGIARTLLHEPQIVFLDEPSSGLDPSGRKMVRKIVKALGEKGRTVLFSSHDLYEISEVCNRALLIYKGENRFIGDASEIDKVWDEIVEKKEEKQIEKIILEQEFDVKDVI